MCDDALFVIPLADVRGFEVRRTLPAKGGGGSDLLAVCDTFHAACPSKTVPVAKGGGADDLNQAAADLAGSGSNVAGFVFVDAARAELRALFLVEEREAAADIDVHDPKISRTGEEPTAFSDRAGNTEQASFGRIRCRSCGHTVCL